MEGSVSAQKGSSGGPHERYEAAEDGAVTMAPNQFMMTEVNIKSK